MILKKKIYKKAMCFYYYIGVNIIGLPLIHKHNLIYKDKGRNIYCRYSYNTND